jgi:hypothetical protein
MNNKLREQIFNKFGGRCAYCGEELRKGWHVDHIAAIKRDSKWNMDKKRFEQTGTCRKPEHENIENYNPSCASCNIQKNSYSVEQFRINIQQFVNSLNTNSTQYKFTKRYGLVKEINKEVIFYFETLNQKDMKRINYKELTPEQLNFCITHADEIDVIPVKTKEGKQYYYEMTEELYEEMKKI